MSSEFEGIMKQATIFRGPGALGKSQVIDYLNLHLSPGRAVMRNLDNDWGTTDWRYKAGGGAATYADLKVTEEILFIKLVWGEPGDGSMAGATKNAGEWVKILRDDGRATRSFLFWAEETEWHTRLLNKNPKEDVRASKDYYDRFKLGGEASDLAITVGIQEEQIDTTNLTLDELKKLMKTKLRI